MGSSRGSLIETGILLQVTTAVDHDVAAGGVAGAEQEQYRVDQRFGAGLEFQ